jgi:putative membrane protein
MENSEGKIIHKGEFNTILRTYILLYVAFILFVSFIGIPLAIIWLCGVGQWYSRHYFEKLEWMHMWPQRRWVPTRWDLDH